MLKSFLELLAELLDSDADLHEGDDSHALGGDGGEWGDWGDEW